MRTNLINDLFAHLKSQGSIVLGDISSEDEAKIKSMPFALDVKRLLQWSWPREDGNVGPYHVYGVPALLKEEDLDLFVKHAMVPVGSAINGDPLVLKFTEDSCTVGLISHDEFWEDRSLGPEACFVTVTDSVDELLWRAVESKYLPIDFYAAIELQEMKNELNLK